MQTASRTSSGYTNSYNGGESSLGIDLPSCLFQYTKDHKWRRLRFVLKRNKFQKMCTRRDSTGVSLLSFALVSRAPLDIFDMILAIDPSQRDSTDDFGATPLHIACLNGAEPQAIKYLTMLNGDLVTTRDIDFRTPLHHAVECICCGTIKYEEGLEIIQILCDADCNMIHAVDKHCDAPTDIVQLARLGLRPVIPADRLDAVYKLLSNISKTIYHKNKKRWEVEGFDTGELSSSSCCHTETTSTTSGGSTILSALQPSLDSECMEIDTSTANMETST